MTAPPRKKVVVLGGGAGALTTAYYLSRTPELRAQYEVTVYQVGWRLGSKGASGRGPHGRIEEHGLHIFWGFYENAFRLMRECYREMNRPSTMPLATFEQAFLPRDLMALQELVQGKWQRWVIPFPSNALLPGESDSIDSTQEILGLLFQTVLELFDRAQSLLVGTAGQETAQGFLDTLQAILAEKMERGTDLLLTVRKLVLEGQTLLEQAQGHIVAVLRGRVEARGVPEGALLDTLRGFLRWLWIRFTPLLESNFLFFQLCVGLDFLVANLVGILSDQVFVKGFNAIDGLDYRAWLAKHGASDLTLRSALSRAIYDAAMSMVDGDPDRQSIGAGSALRALLRIGLTYQGHIAYEFAASMGDVIFVPLYEACRKNGVRFEFFHRVEELVADDVTGRPQIRQIRIGRQVDLKDPSQEYQPFIVVKNLPCWPSQPLWDQIVQGEQLLREGVNLESFYTPWKSVEERVLEVGRDFDHVVFGIPVASVPFLCPSLLEKSAMWRRMVDQVATIQTQSFQLWVSKDLSSLGWTVGSPMLTGYVEPIDTWADMTNLLPREGWAQPNAPRTVAYFCGPLPGPSQPPPPDAHGFPAQETERARKEAVHFLSHDIGVLWPRSTQPKAPGVFDWTLLVPSNGGQGEARFETQYWRANVDPSERYTLSLPGTSKARIRPDRTGFVNLAICGDWVDNGFYIGAAEGAVISGMLACRAVTGQPLPISGEAFWYR
ncbi:NAD(P)-binding protein [Stigmatella sp. ncwal1]|uniref:NAD(P)-binding protein n=1 Tax=Stigmatella ashevillensis TaxID=2995309 RepID=A0ABT5D6I2_9BACT|nr:NAD(P)-binding protein [Stigmatella ashevillena]MDC0707866.1 NAD(P)-binding protein [Stigmatella ashevillena]